MFEQVPNKTIKSHLVNLLVCLTTPNQSWIRTKWLCLCLTLTVEQQKMFFSHLIIYLFIIIFFRNLSELTPSCISNDKLRCRKECRRSGGCWIWGGPWWCPGLPRPQNHCKLSPNHNSAAPFVLPASTSIMLPACSSTQPAAPSYNLPVAFSSDLPVFLTILLSASSNITCCPACCQQCSHSVVWGALRMYIFQQQVMIIFRHQYELTTQIWTSIGLINLNLRVCSGTQHLNHQPVC